MKKTKTGFALLFHGSIATLLKSAGDRIFQSLKQMYTNNEMVKIEMRGKE